MYCVRTPHGSIFHMELTRLSGSLAHFRYVLMVSTPDSVWNGNTGRLSELFLQEQVPDFGTPTFFLCGPKPFMQLAKDLLTKHGVTSDRIKQESFGGPPASTTPHPADDSTLATVHFL